MAEHTAGKAPGPSEPSQHPPAEELRAYLDDRLRDADAQAVADHLEVCDHCVAALDELGSAPIRLPAAATVDAPAWDERRMRRSVRRTVLLTAVNTILLLVLAALVLQLLGWFVVQPLLVDRGDRLTDHVTATIDVPVMTIPGAELSEVMSNPGMFSRTTEVELQRAVGAQVIALGSFTTRLGPRGMSMPSGDIGSRGPSLEPPFVDLGPVPFEPERLAEGTAVTVELTWHEDALDLAAADAVADGAHDVTLLWVGFRIPGGDHPMDPWWRLGYSACGQIPTVVREQRGAVSEATATSASGTSTAARSTPLTSCDALWRTSPRSAGPTNAAHHSARWPTPRLPTSTS